MSLMAIALRVLFAYAFVLVMVRASGKRTIAQVTPMDVLVSLILGDLFDDLFWSEVSAPQFIVSVGILLMTHVTMKGAAARWARFAYVVQGVEQPLVKDGDLVEAGMRAERVNRYGVTALVRLRGEKDLRLIKRAALEFNGRVSVMRRDWALEVQRGDLPALRRTLRKS